MKLKIYVVQTKNFSGERDKKNINSAVGYIDTAADQGAKIICFPEMYPGPAHPSIDFDTSAYYNIKQA